MVFVYEVLRLATIL